jgi:predicted enzyme related to lactoylglutathione lyase
MGAPIVHFEINGPDAAAKREFYGELFGWKLQPIDGMPYTMIDTDSDGQPSIAGGIGEPQDGGGFVTVYALVDDITAALKKAESLGAKTLMERTEMPMVTIGMFADPQGQPIGLVEPPKDQQA